MGKGTHSEVQNTEFVRSSVPVLPESVDEISDYSEDHDAAEELHEAEEEEGALRDRSRPRAAVAERHRGWVVCWWWGLWL
jgi:hypothetical protein